MRVLVDTTIWSLALRRSKGDLNALQKKHLRTLQDLISEGRVQMLGAIRQELLSGIKRHEQFLRLRDHLHVFPNVDLSIEEYEYAAEISNECRRKDITGNPTDFLLCAASIKRKWAVFTSDRDFLHYAKHLPLTLLDNEK